MSHQYPSWLLDAHQSIDFTDLTVKCGPSEFRVHRVVICSQSGFFKAACVNECRESQAAKIELPEDEPQIIERLVEFCYRADYADFPSNRFLQHAKVFGAATKYDLPKLADAAANAYKGASSGNWNAADFLLSVPCVYQSTPESVRGLRDAAVFCAKSHIRKLTESQSQYDAWRSTCLDVPEFAFDVLHNTAKRIPPVLAKLSQEVDHKWCPAQMPMRQGRGGSRSVMGCSRSNSANNQS